MCFLENKARICQGCPGVVTYVKGIRHKCFRVLKEDKGFGACGSKDGPYETREKIGMLCFECTLETETRKTKRKNSMW